MNSHGGGDWALPELDSSPSVIRVCPDVNVPITGRVRNIIDTAAFRRLAKISQLGLVAFVYPGATHSRFEHSLGVYRNAIEFLNRLGRDDLFCRIVDAEHARLFLIASLLHDIGHWPFCHAIEDMRLEGMPRHELLARRLITTGELAELISTEWQLDPERVASFVSGTLEHAQSPDSPSTPNLPTAAVRLLQSMLGGPIDIDKVDYLERDSLHAGVPYGRNFDRNRLIGSLCVDPTHGKLAITEKGRTAAEMMVFARYIMFSEVYWHHAVRSATAMLQRSVYEINHNRSSTDSWIDMNEAKMIDSIIQHSQDRPWSDCAHGLFGPHRKLYKCVAQFDNWNHPDQHRALARKPYSEIVQISQRLSSAIAQKTGLTIGPHDVLIDAPPVKLEVQFQLQVKQSDGTLRSLGEMSPVVHALATRQFDDMVKRVRVFVKPDIREHVRDIHFADLIDA
ncbi:MAG: HD domain-containing protein [Pirellula sp.]